MVRENKKINDDEEVKTKTTTKKEKAPVTVIFIDMVRGSYGAFDVGTIATIDYDVAKLLLKAGVCKECELPKENNDDEDY